MSCSHCSIIVAGGLGNQMFQYALALSLRFLGYDVTLDTSTYDFLKMHNGYELDRVFGIKESVVRKQGLHMFWLRLLAKLKPKGLYIGDHCVFNEEVLLSPSRYINGGWQDERYFSSIADSVRCAFVFDQIDDANSQIAEEMQRSQSVSIHIRRGDYSESGMTIIGRDYYQRAIKYITDVIGNAFFYVFSDDDNVARDIVNGLDILYRIISHNRGEDSYKDMYLMTQCKHNIIANSSFSWWGAWLNNYQDKIVIAPKVWDNKITCFKPQAEGWILV